jgi:carbon starvation protein CstA
VEEEEDEEVEGSAIELFALCRLFVSMAMLLCVGTTVVSALRLERLAFLDFLRVNLKPPASSPVVNATLGFTIRRAVTVLFSILVEFRSSVFAPQNCLEFFVKISPLGP